MEVEGFALRGEVIGVTKAQRDARFAEALAAARAAGLAAGEAAAPTPMVVGTPRDLMGSLMGGSGGGFRDDRPVFVVEGGVCGFAWLSLYAKGQTGRQLAAFLRRQGWNRASRYYGTTWLMVHDFGQSMVRKQAFARAFAASLNEALPELRQEGSLLFSQSRMD
jgi:hypothetical protein